MHTKILRPLVIIVIAVVVLTSCQSARLCTGIYSKPSVHKVAKPRNTFAYRHYHLN